MKQETILRISKVGSAVAGAMAAEEIAKAINKAFESKDPEYSAVEIKTDDGTVYFRRGEYKKITRNLVFSQFSDRRYYADRDRSEQYTSRVFERIGERLGVRPGHGIRRRR